MLSYTRKMSENNGNKVNVSGWRTRQSPSLGASAKLCTLCQSLLDSWDLWQQTPPRSFPHHQHPAEIRSAALNHCPLCYQFLKNGPRVQWIDSNITAVSMIGTHKLTGIYVEINQTHNPETNATEDYFQLRLGFHILHLQGRSTKHNLPPASSSTAGESRFSAFPEFPFLAFGEYRVAVYPKRGQYNEPSIDELGAQSTKSSLKLAKKWLDECSSYHDACKISPLKYRPTRLVSTAMGRCRVHLQNELETWVEYATLSHCWGTIKQLTLKKSNLLQLQIQIPDEALSRTLQDAITIARDLGFAYIWIDTLCIVQDDPEDWRREAATMSSVYGGSGLNISAAGARDGRGGCFFPRPAYWNFQVELSNDNESRSYSAVPASLYSKCLADMPLMERGWVLQERLLAVRTLHFTTTEVFWECNHTTACESFPEKLPDFITAGPKILHKKRLVDSMWPWIVTTYSSCKLTYAHDKLIAISGVARAIQQQTHDRYVAGLWRNDMEAQLCWHTSSPGPRRKTKTYIAPSWSWAALDTRVVGFTRGRSHLSELISVVNVEIVYAGPDPLGAINNGTVRIRCYGLHRARFDTSKKMLLSFDNERSTIGTVHPDNIPDEGEWRFQDVFLLPIFESFGSFRSITGLVLQRVGPGKGIYRRVGFFTVPKKGNHLVEALGDIVDDRDVNLSSSPYTMVLRDTSGVALGYVIDVI